MKRAKPDDPMEKRARKAIGIQLANDRPWLIPEIARFARKEVARALREAAGVAQSFMVLGRDAWISPRTPLTISEEILSLLKREGKPKKCVAGCKYEPNQTCDFCAGRKRRRVKP